MTPEDEATIRKIVREELAGLIVSMKIVADDLNYGRGDLESAALYVVGDVANRMEDMLPHAADCELRERSARYTSCTCGVRNR